MQIYYLYRKIKKKLYKNLFELIKFLILPNIFMLRLYENYTKYFLNCCK